MNEFTLKFFAKLREQTGVDELKISCDEVSHLSELTAYLISKNPSWSPFLNSSLLRAVNQQMVTQDSPIQAGDEVALFPPVTGG
jgi:molybdopterin converting factor subunit 1